MKPSVSYAVSFPQAAQHLVCVEATFAGGTASDGTLDLFLPAWSPGSYMVRDYARHLEAVTAYNERGRALPLHKTRKDVFSIAATPGERVHVRYRVYGREMSVRTNMIDDELALLQGTATFLGCRALAAAPHEVRLTLPTRYRRALCGLPQSSDAPPIFLASSYDELVDSPILCGTPRVHRFVVANVPHELCTVGADDLFDDEKAGALAERVVAQNVALWRQIPYAQYQFYNVALGGQGGLEHRHSSVVMASPDALSSAQGRGNFAGLLAHEHFHAWNIKRLRPRALGPFDYSQENYTPSLWVAEGLTAYYDDLQACRAQATTQAEYLSRLAKSIEALEQTPGRTLAPLTQSSFDAWIKLYKRDENTDNTTVSYYLKGSLVGFVLDAELRRRSAHARSLDDVMRAAYDEYSGAHGFAEDEFRHVVARTVPGDWKAFFAHAVDGVGELDFADALALYGLRLERALADGAPCHRDAAGHLGVTLDANASNAVIASVARATPASDAGLNVDDEIVAVNERRATCKDLFERLAPLSLRDAPARLLVSRFGRLRSFEVKLRPATARKVVLSTDPDASGEQVRARTAWLQPLALPPALAPAQNCPAR